MVVALRSRTCYLLGSLLWSGPYAPGTYLYLAPA